MPYLMVLLYRETPDCSRHKKGEASDSIRQTLLPFLLPSALPILCHCHLLCRFSTPLCNLCLFATQLCQDGYPAIFPFWGHIIPPTVNHVVILFFIYLGTSKILPILHIFLPVFKRRLIHSIAGLRLDIPIGYFLFLQLCGKLRQIEVILNLL